MVEARKAAAGVTPAENGGPLTQQDLDDELTQEFLSSGPSASDPDADEGINWFQAFTLLKSVGHSLHEIEGMGLAEFRGYMSAAAWKRNRDASTALSIATISASAAASGSEEAYAQISEYHNDLKTAHRDGTPT